MVAKLPVKVVSGGQTGVDRGALDAARELKIPHGGWCPRGRLAEDGGIPSEYELQETESASYSVRTERNVLDSDGTLIVSVGKLSGGTELTRGLARRHAKPHLVVDLSHEDDPLEDIRTWIEGERIEVLNVAGPRESSAPGIAAQARALLVRVLTGE